MQEHLFSIHQGKSAASFAPCATPAGPALPVSWTSPRDRPTLGTALPGQGCTSLSHEGVAGLKILPGWIDILQQGTCVCRALPLSSLTPFPKMLKH